jgi:Ca2+-binding RTX toxin-like protein
LIGGAGADALNGGTGFDTASYQNATASVNASLLTPSGNTGDAAGDTYIAIESLYGSSFNDTLEGDANVNNLYDCDGADTLKGGGGNDNYLVNGSNDTIVELAGGGTSDTVYFYAQGSDTAYTLGSNLEVLNLAIGALNGTGNDVANTVNGNELANTLDGGDGSGTAYAAANDTLIGGDGNDTYILRNSGDVVTEAALANSGSNDVIEIRFASTAYTVVANVETVQIAGGVNAGAITANAGGMKMWGNELANTLIGGTGNDVLIGGAGADSFTGNGGTDWVSYENAAAGVNANMTSTTGETGDAAGDTFNTIEGIYGSAFNDTLTGDGNANSLSGQAGNDSLDGAAGNDYLAGGAGNDALTGGAGADIYLVNRGEGYDSITNTHTDALADTLQFGTGVDETQLWFKRNGNDLEVSIIGTTDGATISGWYSNAQNQVANIKDASGHNLAAANVEALVAAMAAFAAPPIGQTTLDTSLQTHLQPVIAASWQ